MTPASDAREADLSGLLSGFVRGIATDSDDRLLEKVAEVGAIVRKVDVVAAQLAAEVAHRSRPELGYRGLAAKHGFRTAALLIRSVSRSTYRRAAALVRVAESVVRPEFRAVNERFRTGELPLGSADGIVRTLEPVADRVDPDNLRHAANVLADEATTVHPDEITRMARVARDSLDRAGIEDRERQLRERRFLTVGPEIDGMRRLSGLLDPESAAIVVSAVDAVTAPRRGGPRFVQPDELERARKVVQDERTTEQLALDALVEMIRIAGDVDRGRVFGRTRPAVRVTMSIDDLRRGTDLPDGENSEPARIEGSSEFVTAATARRQLCSAGALPVVLRGKSEILDVGRAERLFTGPQRTALAVRDGGCRWPDCDRPPSWTEAHHIHPWESGGRTDLNDGILVCRYHHMLVHNNGWLITRGHEPGEYELTAPLELDPDRVPRPMPLKSAALAAYPKRPET